MPDVLAVAIAVPLVVLLYVVTRRRFAVRCPFCSAPNPIRHVPPQFNRRPEDYHYECRVCHRAFPVPSAFRALRP